MWQVVREMRAVRGTTLDAATLASVVEVPHHALSPEALGGVIEEFITRAGTDYGAREEPIEEKIADVQRQLECGAAVITSSSSLLWVRVRDFGPAGSHSLTFHERIA